MCIYNCACTYIHLCTHACYSASLHIRMCICMRVHMCTWCMRTWVVQGYDHNINNNNGAVSQSLVKTWISNIALLYARGRKLRRPTINKCCGKAYHFQNALLQDLFAIVYNRAGGFGFVYDVSLMINDHYFKVLVSVEYTGALILRTKAV